MKFALHGIGTGSTVKPEAIALVARKAEQLGYESLWAPEHLAVPVDMRTPYPYAPDGKFPGGPMVALHDPFLALTYAAACTERIRLGTGVYVLPLRNAIAVAKSVASLDVLSNGRFVFGVGIGWLADEFEAVGATFADRAARAREAIRMMRALWTGEAPRFEGRFHRFPPLGFNPKPVQKPHPPIVLGGETRAALKRAADLGDGWYGRTTRPRACGSRWRRCTRLPRPRGATRRGSRSPSGSRPASAATWTRSAASPTPASTGWSSSRPGSSRARGSSRSSSRRSNASPTR
jgi:probable F420-dependent oxidoreductase